MFNLLLEGPAALTIFSALTIPPFRTVKLRSRKPDCLACGQDGKNSHLIDELDYVTFCGGPTKDYEKEGQIVRDPSHRITGPVRDLVHPRPLFATVPTYL